MIRSAWVSGEFTKADTDWDKFRICQHCYKAEYKSKTIHYVYGRERPSEWLCRTCSDEVMREYE